MLDFSFVGGVFAVFAFQDSTTGFVKLQFGDLDVGRVDTDLNDGAVLLFQGYSLDVDTVFPAVYTNYFSFLVLVFETTYNLYFVVLANWHGSYVVFLAKFGRKWGRHSDTTFGRGSAEVSLAALSAGG